MNILQMWGILQQQQPAPNEPTGDTSIPELHHNLLPLTHPPSPITALTPSAAITAHPHSLLATCISVAFAFSCPQGFAGHTLQLWIPFLTSSSCNLNTGPCDQYFNGSMLTPEHPSLVASDQWCLSPSGWTDTWSLSFLTSEYFHPHSHPFLCWKSSAGSSKSLGSWSRANKYFLYFKISMHGVSVP